ncbi:MAG TPA: DUF86 domain-containing protein [Bacteroidales bacterium]|nr:DUF86 domain-containing protein [Bacteroidales bacterium]
MKNDLLYIDHILESIEKIESYTNDLTKKEFSKNELVQDAVIRNFEIIGETSKKISKDTKQTFHKISWNEISGMRDKLIHDYMGVDIDVIWTTIKKDLIELKHQMTDIKNNLC